MISGSQVYFNTNANIIRIIYTYSYKIQMSRFIFIKNKKYFLVIIYQ